MQTTNSSTSQLNANYVDAVGTRRERHVSPQRRSFTCRPPEPVKRQVAWQRGSKAADKMSYPSAAFKLGTTRVCPTTSRGRGRRRSESEGGVTGREVRRASCWLRGAGKGPRNTARGGLQMLERAKTAPCSLREEDSPAWTRAPGDPGQTPLQACKRTRRLCRLNC